MEDIRINSGTPASEVIKTMARLGAMGHDEELTELIYKLSFELISEVRELLTDLRNMVDASLMTEVTR